MDFAEFRWRHLNFFQHHCIILARVPRADCPEHGVKRVRVPWAREGSGFTLLFEQVALMLAREMPVQARHGKWLSPTSGSGESSGITSGRHWIGSTLPN
ncbi:transposase, IS204/IS1001/IS1096/IS1165 family protein [Acidiphilium sp. JA12-A1]|nr:transposase, IS204/IS1001/IS1096/IS1165 family protein [Acidiphilium sp. JA12-A1]